MTSNLDCSYDGIIIGAGHHGMILGSYLAKCGLDILLVDRRLEYGGGLSTKEVTKPGFYHNLHSINHFHISHTPWFADLGLGDKVNYITPRYEFGQAHRDGSALVFGRDLEETVANVARFSQKDAATFRAWNRKAEEITRNVLLPERYAEPVPQEERERLLARTGVGRDFLDVTRRQPLDVVDELFENEHVKTAVPVQSVVVRHLAHRYAVENEPDGLGHSRLRSRQRLSALSGRLVQSGTRPDGNLYLKRRHVPAAGRYRTHRR
ncbi:MAG: NAD(P)-binding protein [Xanthobacteraceae bacterium]